MCWSASACTMIQNDNTSKLFFLCLISVSPGFLEIYACNGLGNCPIICLEFVCYSLTGNIVFVHVLDRPGEDKSHMTFGASNTATDAFSRLVRDVVDEKSRDAGQNSVTNVPECKCGMPLCICVASTSDPDPAPLQVFNIFRIHGVLTMCNVSPIYFFFFSSCNRCILLLQSQLNPTSDGRRTRFQRLQGRIPTSATLGM